MRRNIQLAALFPETRERILAATLLRPEKSWFLTELAGFLETQPSSLQREIEALSGAGILRQWRDGRRLYVTAERASPIFPDLVHLLEKTAGLIPILQEELEPFADQIQLAFVYGSVAASQEHPDSDVDILLVGRVGLASLVPVLKRLEKRLGRPVNPMIYSTAEFQQKLKKHDHFLTSVLGEKKLFLKGDDDELAAVA